MITSSKFKLPDLATVMQLLKDELLIEFDRLELSNWHPLPPRKVTVNGAVVENNRFILKFVKNDSSSTHAKLVTNKKVTR